MAGSAKVQTVLITMPKYVTISPSNNQLPKIRPAPSSGVTTIDKNTTHTMSSRTSDYCSSGSEDAAPRGKKRRLDHLTWEEKIQRKKLKNRVAAQTSRDRKKARMEEMEVEINNLTQKTEILQNKCESLQAINDSLLEKNQKLDMELELLRQELAEVQRKQLEQQNAINTETVKTSIISCAGCMSIHKGSAVSHTDPLQQGSPQMDQQSTQEQLKKSSTVAALWRIIAICLFYKTCSSQRMTPNSMQGGSKNWQRAYSQISQQTWKHAIEHAMKLLPKMQAAQSDCLDRWWGPQQSAWNPANLAREVMT